MTMNAKIEQHHKDEAAKAAGYDSWESVVLGATSFTESSVAAHAKALANNEALSASLEKATSDLREIDGCLARPMELRSLPAEQRQAILEAGLLASQYRAEPDQDAEEAKELIERWHNSIKQELNDSDVAELTAAVAAKLREIKEAGK